MISFPIMSNSDFKKKFPDIHQQVSDELGIGFVPEIFRCVALANPKLALSSWTMVRENLCAGSIPRITKELMFSYIAYKKHCNYCYMAHYALAIHHGFTEGNVQQIVSDIDSVKNPSLRSVLKLADFSSDNNFEAVCELHDDLISLGFSISELTELIGMVSCAMYMINIANSLGIKADQAFVDVIKVPIRD